MATVRSPSGKPAVEKDTVAVPCVVKEPFAVAVAGIVAAVLPSAVIT